MHMHVHAVICGVFQLPTEAAEQTILCGLSLCLHGQPSLLNCIEDSLDSQTTLIVFPEQLG